MSAHPESVVSVAHMNPNFFQIFYSTGNRADLSLKFRAFPKFDPKVFLADPQLEIQENRQNVFCRALMELQNGLYDFALALSVV